MKRYNAFTIHVTSLDSEFWEWLSDAANEYAYQCRQLGDDVFWFTYVPKELFKYSDNFNWLNGSVKLWIDEILVTKYNYKTKIWNVEPSGENIEGVFHYDYLDYNLMTDVRPVIDEDVLNNIK